ncbi:hypothetical protein IAU60_006683 [Kwoniella sp. DSM 27419]
MPPDTSSRYKSRFSLLSLLPSRHPPLQVSHPMPPTHTVAQRPVIASAASPVHSEYPDPSTPVLQSSSKHHDKFAQVVMARTRSRSPPHRPPPLDLEKTKRMYPTSRHDVIIDLGTPRIDVPSPCPSSGLILPPLPDKGSMENLIEAQKQAEQRVGKAKGVSRPKVVDDPFDVAEVEVGHRYPSWKGGKVDIKPGEVIPRDMIPSLVSISSYDRRKTNASSSNDRPTSVDNYDSVLHNVLLTPTYLGSSVNSPRSTTRSIEGGSSTRRQVQREHRRRTLLDRATATVADVARTARNSKWMPGRSILKPSAAWDTDQSLRAMKDREEQEMARFRRTVRPVRLEVPQDEGRNDDGWSIASSSSPIRENTNAELHARRSPGWLGARERNAGMNSGKAASGEKVDWGRSRDQEDHAKAQRKQIIWKYSVILAIVLLATLIIALCSSLLTRNNDKGTTNEPSSDTAGSTSPASSAPTPKPTASQTLATCLNLFQASAPGSPSSYPCSDCVPVLASTANDFASPLSGGNSTGVGSALQFCALMDIAKGAISHGEGLKGWGKDASPCGGWAGLSCDARGRVTTVKLQYPDVPSELSDTIGNIWALEELRVLGNSAVPAGTFPTSVLSLPNLRMLDLEYTGLRGPIDSAPFAQAKSLTTLVLANNQNLGKTMPDLSGCDQLATVAVTGQVLQDAKVDHLPGGLTYLDLSFNSLSGDVPTFANLPSLSTLYLQSNSFTSAPASLPRSLTSLSLTGNSGLTGNMPSAVCASMTLQQCDLRGTKLSGSASPLSVEDTAQSSAISSSSASSGSASQSISSGSSSAAIAAAPLTVTTSTTSAATSALGSATTTSLTATSFPSQSTLGLSSAKLGNLAGLASAVSMIHLVKREPSLGQATCGGCRF